MFIPIYASLRVVFSIQLNISCGIVSPLSMDDIRFIMQSLPIVRTALIASACCLASKG